MRFFPATTFFLLLLASCNGGTSSARLPELKLPLALADGMLVEGEAAEAAFAQWRNSLSTDPILPLALSYALNSKVEVERDGEKLSGSAVGDFRFQGIDDDRARLDAFLVLRGIDWDKDWNLTGTLQFDGFFVRAWGTASGIDGVDPDRTYAVQFAQGVFEDTYASLQRLMPTFLRALRESGIGGAALITQQVGQPAVQMFHPARFLSLVDSAFVCRSIRYEEDRIHCVFALDLREGSPLRPAFESLLGVAPEELGMWAETTTVEEVFEPRTGLLLGVNFLSEYSHAPGTEDAVNALLQFQLQATSPEWRIADLDRVLSRPEEVNPLDLTAMLKLADQFLREKGNEIEAQGDFDLH